MSRIKQNVICKKTKEEILINFDRFNKELHEEIKVGKKKKEVNKK